MPTAEEFNQRRAHGLAVLVMDILRARTAVGDTVTLWTLNAAICERYGLKGPKRDAQYKATSRVVNNLEAAGVIGSKKEWDKEGERYTKRLWPCSTN